MSAQESLNPQQFFHGTNAHFRPGDVIDPSTPHRVAHGESGEGVLYMTTKSRDADQYAMLSGHAVHVPGRKPSKTSIALGIARRQVYYPPDETAKRYTVEPLGDVQPDKNGGRAHKDAYETAGPVRVVQRYRLNTVDAESANNRIMGRK